VAISLICIKKEMKKETAPRATGRRNLYRENVRKNYTERAVVGQPRRHVYDFGKKRTI
jgi:hypothetical protein